MLKRGIAFSFDYCVTFPVIGVCSDYLESKGSKKFRKWKRSCWTRRDEFTTPQFFCLYCTWKLRVPSLRLSFGVQEKYPNKFTRTIRGETFLNAGNKLSSLFAVTSGTFCRPETSEDNPFRCSKNSWTSCSFHLWGASKVCIWTLLFYSSTKLAEIKLPLRTCIFIAAWTELLFNAQLFINNIRRKICSVLIYSCPVVRL